LVERHVRNVEVGGSSPLASTRDAASGLRRQLYLPPRPSPDPCPYWKAVAATEEAQPGLNLASRS
jgi:hypothetical protein